MDRLIIITVLAFGAVGCRHAQQPATAAALRVWRSPRSSLQQRADAVNGLIPQGTRIEEVEAVLGKQGAWTRFQDPPIFRYVYKFPDGDVSLEYERSMGLGDKFWAASVPLIGLPVRHHLDQYNLTFCLPASWRGYSVSVQQLEDVRYSLAEDRQVVVGQTPMITLRHPQWRAHAPYQDIPIVVFTRAQWDALHQGELWPSLFAGGVMMELWHSQGFVFAISSRFNANDEVRGWKEVTEIVEQNCAANKMPCLYPE